MTALAGVALILAVVLAAIIFSTVVVAATANSDKRNDQLAKMVERCADLAADSHRYGLDLADRLAMMTETFGSQISAASLRESSDIKALLDAGISQRDRLLTALLSVQADPRAAQRFGIVDQALARTDRDTTSDPALRAFMRDAVARNDDLTDDDGQPIIPSGWAGA